jgi:hypothetical protein
MTIRNVGQSDATWPTEEVPAGQAKDTTGGEVKHEEMHAATFKQGDKGAKAKSEHESPAVIENVFASTNCFGQDDGNTPPGLGKVLDGGKKGTHTETMRAPSDDGHFGPGGPKAPHAETMRAPSDDGHFGPGGPKAPHAETMRAPSDDGHFGPGGPKAPHAETMRAPSDDGSFGPGGLIIDKKHFPTLPVKGPDISDVEPNEGIAKVLKDIEGNKKHFPTLPPHEGVHTETLRAPSDDGSFGPGGAKAPHAETMRAPSDDGKFGPGGPKAGPQTETMRFPSDDGGFAPGGPKAGPHTETMRAPSDDGSFGPGDTSIKI